VWISIKFSAAHLFGGMDTTGNFTGNSTGCTYCNLHVTQYGLVRHVNTAHRSMSTGELNALEGFSKWRECDYCSSRFVGDRGLATHIRVAHQGRIGAVVPSRTDAPAIIPVSLLEDTIVADLQDQYEDNDFIPACPWEYRIQQAPADYGYLVGKYPKGAYYQHHTWRAPLQKIVLKLLETSVSEY
jgi:hypothetical protein